MHELYKAYVVAFLDILGFRDTIDQTKDNPIEIKNISDALAEVRQTIYGISGKFDIKARMFSDTILITCSNTNFPSLGLLLGFIASLQIKFIEKSHFLRGAVAIGDHYESDEVMFGPTMIQAYETEKLAIWPRVVIHPSVWENLERIHIGFVLESLVRRSKDGLAYLDYLQTAFPLELALDWVQEYSKEMVSSSSPVTILSTHKSAILKLAKQKPVNSRTEILTKYHNLAEYHNMVLEDIARQLTYWAGHGKPEPSTCMEILCTYPKSHASGSAVESPANFKSDNFNKFWQNKCDELLNHMDSIRSCVIDLRQAFPILYGISSQ